MPITSFTIARSSGFKMRHLPVILGLGLFFAAGNIAAQQVAAPQSSSTEHQQTEARDGTSTTTSHLADVQNAQTEACPQPSPCPKPEPCPETKPCPETQTCPSCPAARQLDAGQLAAVQMLSGIVTTAITLPTSLALGVAIGTGPSDLYAAGLPALLVLAVLPPVATATAEWGLSRWLVGEQTGSLWWSMGAAGLTHVGAIGTAVALRVSTHDIPATTTYVVSESLLLPSVVTATLALTAASEQAEDMEAAQ